MTDAEINLAIARLEYPDYKIRAWEGKATVTPVGHPSIRGIDYMEWHWIGPIIEREEIHLRHVVNSWEATTYADDAVMYFEGEAETPTKAAALCYLKMKGQIK